MGYVLIAYDLGNHDQSKSLPWLLSLPLVFRILLLIIVIIRTNLALGKNPQLQICRKITLREERIPSTIGNHLECYPPSTIAANVDSFDYSYPYCPRYI